MASLIIRIYFINNQRQSQFFHRPKKNYFPKTIYVNIKTPFIIHKMRLTIEQQQFLSQFRKDYFPNFKLYLFGSRTDNQQKGGDIDLLIIGDRHLTIKEKTDFKAAFWQQFGEQKIDLVSLKSDEKSSFKNLILSSTISL